MADGRLDDPFEWGGPDLPSGRTASLDAAMREAERRHHGTDAGAHHQARADASGDLLGHLDGHLAMLRLWEDVEFTHHYGDE